MCPTGITLPNPSYQVQLLFSAPTFQLSLSFKRRAFVWMFFRIKNLYYSTRSGVMPALARFMFFKSSINIICYSCIQGTICALDNIYKIHIGLRLCSAHFALLALSERSESKCCPTGIEHLGNPLGHNPSGRASVFPILPPRERISPLPTPLLFESLSSYT